MSFDPLTTNQKEAIRYLGFGAHTPDERTLALVSECVKELAAAVSPKSIWRDFPLSLKPDNQIEMGYFTVKSRNLSRNLTGCSRIILFGATLGIGADNLISRNSRLNVTKGVVLQACAASMIEDYCDYCQEEIRQQMAVQHLYLRPRFSPGYGDFPLESQREITRILNTPKEIGLTLTDSMLMVPIKSVTAVIGLSPLDEHCHQHGCEACEKTDCAFRR